LILGEDVHDWLGLLRAQDLNLRLGVNLFSCSWRKQSLQRRPAKSDTDALPKSD
jgi:hypothetical protein